LQLTQQRKMDMVVMATINILLYVWYSVKTGIVMLRWLVGSVHFPLI
jgi:hypothetical protein